MDRAVERTAHYHERRPSPDAFHCALQQPKELLRYAPFMFFAHEKAPMRTRQPGPLPQQPSQHPTVASRVAALQLYRHGQPRPLRRNGRGKALHWWLTDQWYHGKAPTRDFLAWDGELFTAKRKRRTPLFTAKRNRVHRLFPKSSLRQKKMVTTR